ncbi:uncharacterized protein ASCRUDRAFT_75864 [Ascoidea rubescens DSM 1968]|uniref:Uncharacterized protein n=1 Tax=Ascoidea rubescens DSM 1968 TaxID=1344418 RepID=A0A1D2VHN2_9ASCO|nr:hypothetical protein ASCRUDRAFT_75864 [Ascoidea rubescens DSM 1968]ODV61146.1 hypothetical protein ASCRUDRAFT_75864 [Ascoidea rubescens DSM 1968]
MSSENPNCPCSSLKGGKPIGKTEFNSDIKCTCEKQCKCSHCLKKKGDNGKKYVGKTELGQLSSCGCDNNKKKVDKSVGAKDGKCDKCNTCEDDCKCQHCQVKEALNLDKSGKTEVGKTEIGKTQIGKTDLGSCTCSTNKTVADDCHCKENTCKCNK